MQRFLYVLWIVLATLVLAGCSLRPSGTAPLTPGRGPMDVRVAVVLPDLRDPYHMTLRDGAVRAAERLSWQIDIVSADPENDSAGQVTAVEQEIQKGITALAITPVDAKAAGTAVKTANLANIPILIHNVATPLEEGYVAGYVGYNQRGGAEQLAKHSCSLLGGEGEVFILSEATGFETNERTQGFKDGLQKHCPGVRIVGEQTIERERKKATEAAVAALQKHSNIKLFYGDMDEIGIGACIAAKQVGKAINRDIFCVGIDGAPAALDLIEQGEFTATLGVHPDKIGEMLVRQMEKYINGEQITQILETPAVVVDAANLADYRSGKTWVEPKEGDPDLDGAQAPQ